MHAGETQVWIWKMYYAAHEVNLADVCSVIDGLRFLQLMRSLLAMLKPDK